MVCPNEVKSTGVSLTINPVTHTAEVAVKTASIKRSSPLWAKERERSKAPTKMTTMKLKSISFISRVCMRDPLENAINIHRGNYNTQTVNKRLMLSLCRRQTLHLVRVQVENTHPAHDVLIAINFQNHFG